MDDDVGQVVAAQVVSEQGAVEREDEEQEWPIAAGGRAGGAPGVLGEDPPQPPGIEVEDVRHEELVVVHGRRRRRVDVSGGGQQRHAERREPGKSRHGGVQGAARGGRVLVHVPRDDES